ncbi:MAG: cytochrome c-type biogenesis protein CcmH [Chloroflexota bacterium]
MKTKKLQITNYELWLAMITVLALSIAFTMNVLAQGTTPTDDDVNQVAKQLYCPVCESTPLDVCPTEACRQWREVIRTMLADGKSETEIKQYFVTQYGVRVLNVPPNPWLTYFIPGVVILIGALLLARGFQLWRKPLAAESAPIKQEAQPVQQDEYLAKMEEELRKRK